MTAGITGIVFFNGESKQTNGCFKRKIKKRADDNIGEYGLIISWMRANRCNSNIDKDTVMKLGIISYFNLIYLIR